ncbi:2-oxoglutarate dehydrogenase, E2 component, dihydrolipoamide succinyltransferase [Helcobacillus sp. ACRRO]|uniref:2-oxoglutarate dehydrogenase, E2 component, dihydrolipoamide succinyltransferase n=1 Tax=Helcobacillus sp. ACRRO TaxID=2918202 RepID=UPI001EF4DA6E|nr:2-oxoglutarate dehydrogenase, E2 component, dihydrolipoamide succinyltransferase [Helcobacillus sp. ACRRO]MCG7427312.1 2-oxoglutarate dehydrogenase, E2 component, dihydrolipoamide succinyltransferase [Helcobacillus sp. ACRRO]
MSEKVQMPALGESVTEGTVTRWLKDVGDTVEVDEPLLEVSTDKVDTEIPSPVAGVLEEILVAEDEDAEVGADLAVIGSGDGASSDAEKSEDDSAADEASQEPAADDADDSADDVDDDAASEDDAPAESSGGSGEGEEVTMPALGESVTEGTVTRWLKDVGDEVEVDEPLLEVSTDKVDTEIPSPVAGVLQEIRVKEDEEAEIGAVIAVIGSGAASGGSSEKPAPAKQEEKSADASDKGDAQKAASEPAAEEKPAKDEKQEQKAEASATADSSLTGSSNATAYVTPIVRKLAKDSGVDLSQVTGTGVGGRIRKQDVKDAAEKQKQAAEAPSAPSAGQQHAAPAAAKPSAPVEMSPLRGTEQKMTRLRKIVAERMVESLHTQAQLTTAVEVDMTRIAALRSQAKDQFAAREGAKLTFLPFIMQAAVEALKTYPVINAEIQDGMIKYHGSENIGMAADTERGLVVPVIKNAGDLNLAGLARQIGELGGKAKNNKLGPDDLQGATFTITNTGSGGALWDTPIVPNPQVGILGCGTIVKRPAVVKDQDGNDTIAIRSMMYLFLSYDHRLVDGADAARFLTHMKARLEEGAFGSELGL